MRFILTHMKNSLWIGPLALLCWVVWCGATPKAAEAQTMLYVDFETKNPSKTFPDKKFNNASEWNKGAQTPALVNWVNVEHSGSGKLHQTKNTNANTTTTVAPAPADCKNWTDYTAQMTVTYDDNDKQVLVFRYTDADNYYFFAVEQTAQAYLRKAPAPDGQINGIAILQAPVPGVAIKMGNFVEGDLPAPIETEEWVLRVEVEGDNIRCYFFSRKDIKNLDEPAPNAPIIEAQDNANPKGCVGARNDSIVGTVDDFLVYGPKGATLAVEAGNKLTTTWGAIRTMRY